MNDKRRFETNSRKLILMDFDDTITDNSEADYYSFIKTKNKIKPELKEMSIEEFKKLRKSGWLAHEIIKKMINSDNNEMIEHFNNIRQEILLMDKEMQDKVRLNEGVPETLEYLKSKDLILAITTCKSNRKIVEKLLKKFGISHYFDNIFCRERNNFKDIVEIKRDIYIKALNYYKVMKEDVVVVGNLSEDLIPAREMGIKCIGVISNYSKEEDLERYGEVISDIKGLKVIL